MAQLYRQRDMLVNSQRDKNLIHNIKLICLNGLLKYLKVKGIVMSLGSRIRELRKSKNMSQVALAKKAGVSQPVISEYENDLVREHRMHILLKIAAALETTPNYLLNGTGEVDIANQPSSLVKLADTYMKLTPDAQAMLLAIAETMQKK